MRNNHYNKNLREFSRELRTETISKAEKFIWKCLLSKKQMGVGFKRQRPIDRFIVDFFSAEIGLIIEIDGNSHLNKGEYDSYRQNKLRLLGYEIVRFQEGEVLADLDEVHRQLVHVIACLRERK